MTKILRSQDIRGFRRRCCWWWQATNRRLSTDLDLFTLLCALRKCTYKSSTAIQWPFCFFSFFAHPVVGMRLCEEHKRNKRALQSPNVLHNDELRVGVLKSFCSMLLNAIQYLTRPSSYFTSPWIIAPMKARRAHVVVKIQTSPSVGLCVNPAHP